MWLYRVWRCFFYPQCRFLAISVMYDDWHGHWIQFWKKGVGAVLFNATFNNISVTSYLKNDSVQIWLEFLNWTNLPWFKPESSKILTARGNGPLSKTIMKSLDQDLFMWVMLVGASSCTIYDFLTGLMKISYFRVFKHTNFAQRLALNLSTSEHYFS